MMGLASNIVDVQASPIIEIGFHGMPITTYQSVQCAHLEDGPVA